MGHFRFPVEPWGIRVTELSIPALGEAEALRAHGADVVVSDLAELLDREDVR